MVDSASSKRKQQTPERVFVKKVGDETLRRQVTSPQAEVAARFDGYAPEDEATQAKPSSSTGGRSGGAANTGGSNSS